jgi:hypothetical protein
MSSSITIPEEYAALVLQPSEALFKSEITTIDSVSEIQRALCCELKFSPAAKVKSDALPPRRQIIVPSVLEIL